MKTAKRIVLLMFISPILYLIIAYVLTLITVNKTPESPLDNQTIYLSSNGIHLDIVIHKNNLIPELSKGLAIAKEYDYIAFGWGDKDFYLNTPTWKDLSLKTAFKAMFLPSETLMHVTQYKHQSKKWTTVHLTNKELEQLNKIINQSFGQTKSILPNSGYGINDTFYKAIGSYSILKTCNTWVNDVLKKSGLKACLWTPFSFGLEDKYKD